jgi:DNA repair exonuclease SbcCD ATPase subunit
MSDYTELIAEARAARNPTDGLLELADACEKLQKQRDILIDNVTELEMKEAHARKQVEALQKERDRYRDTLNELLEYTDSHRSSCGSDWNHDCYEEWQILKGEAAAISLNRIV